MTDKIKVHTEPKEGIKGSHNREEVMEKIENKAGPVHFSNHEYNHGKIRQANLISLIFLLSQEPSREIRNMGVEELTEKLSDICGIDKRLYQGEYNSFSRNELWKVWEKLK